MLDALAIIATAIAVCACHEERRSHATPSSTASAAAEAPALPRTAAVGSTPGFPKRAGSADRSEPARLVSLSSSAYHASIAADDGAAYLLTSQAAYRLAPGRAPEALEVPLGFGATSTRNALIFWSEGAVREASKRGGGTHRVVALARRPQTFVSSDDDVAWVERSDAGRFSLGSVSGKRASTAYTSPGKIDAAAMLSDWVFFVERPTDTEWRIGGVRAQGGAPVFTSSRGGRAPSMLVARRELHYYDGNRREVRRLSPDLRDEETLVSDFICSPLAVAERVYCANVEGIFELVPGARPRRLVTLGKSAAATGLAANASHLYWVFDAGADKLEVRALALAESR